MWEVLLSLRKLRDDEGTLVFGEWRRRVRARWPTAADGLLALVPPRGYAPDFLTPVVMGGGFEQALAEVLATPRATMRADLRRLGRQQPLSASAQALADGDASALRELGRGLRSYFRMALAPYWTQIGTAVHGDLAVRARDLAGEGMGKVLADLHPLALWRPPVLAVPYSTDRDLYLEGRGLLLVPSFFCWQRPITLRDPARPPALVYPIEHDLAWLRRCPSRPSATPLAALFGRTRLSVLAVIAGGSCTTTQLAQRAGISIASASQHATVLREAGLITTTRHGSCVIHAITQAAADLISRGETVIVPAR
jgi:DNA-binding transcriptional ArsR family regulator